MVGTPQFLNRVSSGGPMLSGETGNTIAKSNGVGLERDQQQPRDHGVNMRDDGNSCTWQKTLACNLSGSVWLFPGKRGCRAVTVFCTVRDKQACFILAAVNA